MNTLPTLSVPSYRLTIPSSGKEVQFRPYLVKEEKILMIAQESTDGDQIQDAILNVIENCLIDYDGDVRQLTAYDVEWIFLQLRSKSVGESIDIIKFCDEEDCDGETQIKIDIGKAIIKNKEKSANTSIKVEEGLVVEVKFPTIESGSDVGDDDTDILINTVANALSYIHYGDEIYDANGVTIEERRKFVESLTNEQFGKIIDFLLDAPYVYYEDEFTCSKCGTKQTFNYEGILDFFI